MVKWLAIDDSESGTTFTGRMIHNQRIKIHVPSDRRHRSRVWLWDSARKVWIEKLQPGTVENMIRLLPRAKQAKQAPAYVLEPAPNDPRDSRVDWQAIIRHKKGSQYVLNTPSNTKRSGRTKIAAARGQSGNAERQGSG